MINIYKLFLKDMPWPTWIQKPDSTVVFVNEKYCEVYGIKLEDVKEYIRYLKDTITRKR